MKEKREKTNEGRLRRNRKRWTTRRRRRKKRKKRTMTMMTTMAMAMLDAMPMIMMMMAMAMVVVMGVMMTRDERCERSAAGTSGLATSARAGHARQLSPAKQQLARGVGVGEVQPETADIKADIYADIWTIEILIRL
jgi:DUF917 family protein